MMTWFHPIGELLGEIDWLLDAPDAEDAFFRIVLAGKPAEGSFGLHANLGVLNGTSNLSNGQVHAINLDHQTIVQFHIDKLLGHRERIWLAGLMVVALTVHPRSLRHIRVDNELTITQTHSMFKDPKQKQIGRSTE